MRASSRWPDEGQEVGNAELFRSGFLVLQQLRPNMMLDLMDQFDYHQPAELFVHSRRGRMRGAASFQKFVTAAEALRYAIESLDPVAQAGAVIETDQGRYEARELRSLYDSSEYPLPRATNTAPLS